ncbi:MAG: proton-conducting transporter membrane subunit [Candidatus Neomarinimicrobiota bacterium]
MKICLVLMAIGLFSIITRDRRTKPIITAEFGFLFCCLIFAALVTVSTNHLIVLFIALQIINLTDFLISQRNNSNPEIITSGWHDLIFHVFSGMVMLMGIVLIYGITGSLFMADIGRMLAIQPGLKFPVTMAWVMILFGFTHSITGVLRLHRDLRSGPVTSEPVRLISLTIPQFAEIGVLIRLIEVGFGKIADQRPLFLTLSLFAVIAIVYPGWLAIKNRNLRDTLNISGLAQTGFSLLALCALNSSGNSAAIFYEIIFVFGAIAYVAGEIVTDKGRDLAMPGQLVFLASLAGIPLTAGFAAKYLVFSSLAGNDPGKYLLIAIGIFGYALMFVYYGRLIRLNANVLHGSFRLSIQADRLIFVLRMFILIAIIFMGVNWTPLREHICSIMVLCIPQ